VGADKRDLNDTESALTRALFFHLRAPAILPVWNGQHCHLSVEYGALFFTLQLRSKPNFLTVHSDKLVHRRD
jgi:hypothetical protein